MPSKDDILKLPNETLRQKSTKVSVVDEKVRNLIEELEEIGLDWEDSRDFEVCVGLAAVQIGKLKKVVILRSEDPKKREFDVLINPKIVKTYGQPELDFEGCLSVTDLYGLVPRYPKVKVQALNENGKVNRFTTEGFRARLIQHEIDHLNGLLFIDHIEDQEDAFHYISESGKIEQLDYDKVKALGIFR